MKESPFPSIPDAPPDPSIPWKEAAIVGRCESSGGHIVTPATWPPRKRARPEEPPSFSLQCQRCKAWLIVYTDDMPGVTVQKPEPMQAAQRK